jgi:general secretion pathway protein B
MSFILDALKKAESERGRAAGPVLVDVRIAPPRRRLPAWAWVLGAVLVANLAVLAWLMLRTPRAPALVADVAAANAAASAAPAASTSVATLPPSPLPPPTLREIEPVVLQAPSRTAAVAPAVAPARTTPAADPGLPTQRELQARGITLPPLLLNLHVYDPSPQLRFVMLNGLRLAEGDFTPDGIRVEAVTERGVVLDARGQRFLLPTGN